MNGMFPLMLFVAEAGVYAGGWILAKTQSDLPEENRKEFKLLAFGKPMLWLVERSRLPDRLPSLTLRISTAAVFVHRCKKSKAAAVTKCVYAEILTISFLLQLLFVMADFIVGERILTEIGPLFFLIVPLLLERELRKKADHVKRAILIELPELLTKIALLVNAGDTLQNAVLRCADAAAAKSDNRLYRELADVRRELAQKYTFPQAMEHFARRCAVQEVSLFVSIVLIHYRRGGNEIVVKLRDLSRECWEKRKNIAKSIGEEASSKMVFPMVIIFFVIMVIVTAPALMMMNQ